MTTTLDWVYPRRDPLAWATAFALGAGVLALGLRDVSTPPRVERELLALIEKLPEPVPVMRPAPPPPPAPRPVPKALDNPKPALMPQPAPTPVPVAAPAPASTPAASTPAASIPAPGTVSAIAPPPPPASPVIREPAVAPPVPTPPPPAAPPPPASASVSATYESQLLALIERAKRYPNSREARQTRPQGTARVWLELTRDGQLRSVGVAESSGSNILDGAALGTVRSVSFPPFPETAFPGQDAHRFVVNIKYELRSD